MKVSAIVMALVLLVLAVPFLLERMDLMDAGWLRFEPAAIAIVIAAAIIIMALRRKRAARKQGKEK